MVFFILLHMELNGEHATIYISVSRLDKGKRFYKAAGCLACDLRARGLTMQHDPTEAFFPGLHQPIARKKKSSLIHSTQLGLHHPLDPNPPLVLGTAGGAAARHGR
jgi:hypothetical protein